MFKRGGGGKNKFVVFILLKKKEEKRRGQKKMGRWRNQKDREHNLTRKNLQKGGQTRFFLLLLRCSKKKISQVISLVRKGWR